MASDAVEAAKADKAARDARANAAIALRGTVASSILNRANIKESRESQIVQGQVGPGTNSNSREGRSGIVRPYVPPVINTGTTTPGPKDDTIPTPDPDPYIPQMDPMPQPEPAKPPGAKDLGVVKNPSRDVTDIASLVPQADESTVARLLFEQFSAVELAQILTPRTIDGIEQQYSVISNLSDIRRRYNSTKQLTVMDKLAPISGVFGIDLNSKIPGDDYILRNNLDATYSYIDENNQQVTVEKGYIYIDTNGDLVIEFDNMTDDELVQVQIDTNGTIYEVTK